MQKTNSQAQKSTKPLSNPCAIRALSASTFLLALALSLSVLPHGYAAESEKAKIQVLERQIKELIDRQDFQQAAELAGEALSINESATGKSDPSNIPLLNNLGWLLEQKGDMSSAREKFERSVSLAEQNKDDPENLAWSLNNLATLLYAQGDFESAKSKFEMALSASERGKDQSRTAQILKSLAGVYDALDKKSEAIATYRRALELIENPTNSQDQNQLLQLAQLMEDLACSLEDKGQYEEAASYLNRSLQTKEKVLGADNPELSSTLNNLGILQLDTKKTTEAKALFERALLMLTKSKGDSHIDLVPVLNNLGDLSIVSADKKSAYKYYLQASKIINKYLNEILPYLSMAEQHQAMGLYCNDQVSRLISSCTAADELQNACNEFIAWKGTLVGTLAAQANLRRSAKTHPELESTFSALAKLRSEISAWYFEAGQTPLSKWKEKYDSMCAEKERLERQLGGSTKLRTISNPGLEELFSALGEDEAIVDIYKYDRFSRSEQSEELIKNSRYCALLIEKDKPPKLFDLGDSNNLQALTARWRQQVLSMENDTAVFKAISQVLSAPLIAAGKKVTRLWVCPDSELSRLPWHLLSDEAGRLELVQLCHIDSCRELLTLKSLRKEARSMQETLLVMGGVNFNAGPENAEKSAMQMPYLAGTLKETKAIAEMGRASQLAVIQLTGDAASKISLKKFLPESEYVHLATHGFFLDESVINSIRAQNEASKRSITLRARYDSNLVRRNPLVESGIMLAGANKINPEDKAERSGVLTAEEFADTDLSKCKLLSLSACDTGRGHELTGQGVMGLRASIMAAGAHNILMSLWKVPDEPTAILMREFYKNLWDKKLSAAQSLREAQSSLKKLLPEGAHQAVNWAGWVLVGEGW